jgi:hypothetical protein
LGDLPWLCGLDAPEGDAAAVAAVACTELELPVRSNLQRLRREHSETPCAKSVLILCDERFLGRGKRSARGRATTPR